MNVLPSPRDHPQPGQIRPSHSFLQSSPSDPCQRPKDRVESFKDTLSGSCGFCGKCNYKTSKSAELSPIFGEVSAMAGHSQFKNIMHRKGKQDAIRAKLFAKLAREITVAARAGLPDPNANSRLRLAVQNARAENMPKDNIERAIKKAE